MSASSRNTENSHRPSIERIDLYPDNNKLESKTECDMFDDEIYLEEDDQTFDEIVKEKPLPYDSIDEEILSTQNTLDETFQGTVKLTVTPINGNTNVEIIKGKKTINEDHFLYSICKCHQLNFKLSFVLLHVRFSRFTDAVVVKWHHELNEYWSTIESQTESVLNLMKEHSHRDKLTFNDDFGKYFMRETNERYEKFIGII